ncbi:MAG: hypothetical protein KC713_03385 [Candidatus Omnitrophica bacterium]|nr:hypothetical protein [Candidatus Omnitrophota bacterium]
MAEVFKKFEYALVPYKLQPIFIFILINVVLISMGIFFKKEWINILGLESTPFLNKWGGSIVYIVRIYILISILTLTVYISSPKVGKKIFSQSISAAYLSNASMGMYEVIYDNLIQKINPNEKKNERIYGVIPVLPQKNKQERYLLD